MTTTEPARQRLIREREEAISTRRRRLRAMARLPTQIAAAFGVLFWGLFLVLGILAWPTRHLDLQHNFNHFGEYLFELFFLIPLFLAVTIYGLVHVVRRDLQAAQEDWTE